MNQAAPIHRKSRGKRNLKFFEITLECYFIVLSKFLRVKFYSKSRATTELFTKSSGFLLAQSEFFYSIDIFIRN